jgi:hypothetical protein
MQTFRLVVRFPDPTNAELMANFQRFSSCHFYFRTPIYSNLRFKTVKFNYRTAASVGFTLQGETFHA